MSILRVTTQLAVAVVVGATPASAQEHQHTVGMAPPTASSVVRPAGQGAFGAIADVVARLDADPGTDWSMVDLERLRQHLIDMDRVTLHSTIVQQEVSGGFTAEVTGDDEVAGAIRRMLAAHAAQMAVEGAANAVVDAIAGGARITVTAPTPGDRRAVTRLRGLGVIGFLALGGHHGPHHEMLARGVGMH